MSLAIDTARQGGYRVRGRGSKAVLYRSADGALVSVKLNLKDPDKMCEGCGDMFIVESRCLIWSCDVCGGGSAWIDEEIHEIR